MSTERINDPGTFGSTSKTTTFYPLKSSQPLQWFNTLFFLVLAICTIAPDFTHNGDVKRYKYRTGSSDCTCNTLYRYRGPYSLYRCCRRDGTLLYLFACYKSKLSALF